jgi:hypothetical protein
MEETHYNERGDLSRKIIIEKGIKYEHSYINDNRLISMFQKIIEGEPFEMILKHIPR